MKVELVFITPDPEAHIGAQAAECYDSKTDRDSCLRRAGHCLNSGHLATLRFAYATFHIAGISRACSHQMVRVAHAGILQRCVSGDTRIAICNNEKTGDIRWMPIRRMYELQQGAKGSHLWKARVRVFDEQNKQFVIANVKEVFFNGIKPVFDVEAEGGISIRATEHHKFLTKDGFRSLNELRVGDYIARNGAPAYQDKDWLAAAKRRAIADKTGLAGIAAEAGVSTHCIRIWLRKHSLQFTKSQVAEYTSTWNKGLKGEELPWFGRKASTEQRETLSKEKIGDRNPFWAGGATAPRQRIANRTSSRKLTREFVFTRDGHACVVCGSSENLEVDHVEPVRERPDLAFSVDNLQTLCASCHSKKSVEESNRIRKTVRWIQITSIAAAGEEEVFDLEVDHDSHNYVANKLVVHNSQRYVKESRVEYIDPPGLPDLPPHLRAAWQQVQANAEAVYLAAIGCGMPKGDARYILPQGCTTSLRITGNFQMWRDLLANRTDKAAQWEIRAVAQEIKRQLAQHAPVVFA